MQDEQRVPMFTGWRKRWRIQEGERMEEGDCKEEKWRRVGGEKGGTKRFICLGVRGQLSGPVGPTVGIQSGTQEVLFVSTFNW